MAQSADILLFFLGTALSGQRGNKLQLKLRFDLTQIPTYILQLSLAIEN